MLLAEKTKLARVKGASPSAPVRQCLHISISSSYQPNSNDTVPVFIMSSGYGLAGGIGITPPPLPLSQPNSRLAHSPLPSSITNHLSYLHRQLMPTSQAHPAVSPSGKSC